MYDVYCMSLKRALASIICPLRAVIKLFSDVIVLLCTRHSQY